MVFDEVGFAPCVAGATGTDSSMLPTESWCYSQVIAQYS